VGGAELTIDVRDTEGVGVVRVAGDLDVDTCPDLMSIVDPLVAGGQHVVLDLSPIEFMDSTALACLLAARNVAIETSGSLRVSALSPPVRSLLEVTGLLDVLTDGFLVDQER
jgi:anti-anti-sigma factor